MDDLQGKKTFKKRMTLKDKAHKEFLYGKHKGETLGSVVLNDPQYAQWASETMSSGFVKSVLTDLIKHQKKIPGLLGIEDEAKNPALPVVNHRKNAGSSRGGDRTLLYGKHKGRTFQEVVNDDRDYAEWAAKTMKSEFMRNTFQQLLSSGSAGFPQPQAQASSSAACVGATSMTYSDESDAAEDEYNFDNT